MAHADHPAEGRSGPQRRDAASSPGATGGDRLMLVAVACCGAIPLALLIAAVATGSGLGGVSPWALVTLTVAFAAAMALSFRLMLRRGSD